MRRQRRPRRGGPHRSPPPILSRPVGVDVGGTKCLAVALGDDGAVAAEAHAPTPAGPHLAAVVGDLVADVAGGAGPASIGLGLPGLVERTGELRFAPNLASAVGVDVAGPLAERFGVAVAVDNDATGAARAEWSLGAGRGASDVVVVTVGTGLGGGLVVGGQVVVGYRGFAGEVGHIPVVADGEPCPCGQSGCWERYASGSALPRLIEAHAELAGWTPQAVTEAAATGDPPAARAVIDELARWLAVGLAGLVVTLDPERIVLGGGVIGSAAGDQIVQLVGSHLAAEVSGASTRGVPPVVAAELGPEAGAIGAALAGMLA